MEETLNLYELQAIRLAMMKKDHEDRRWSAMIQHGHDIGEFGATVSDVEAIKRRAAAKARGMTEDQYAFAEVGIAVVEE